MAFNRAASNEQRFIHTRRVDEVGEWYALDNAAIIMPAVANRVTTSLFRFEAELDEPIDFDAMNAALAATAARMPYFNVTLRRGLFWYYFEPCKDTPPLYPDSPSPCQDWDINRRGTRLLRIRCEENRVAGEFSHAMTDGTGGLTFFKTLLANYFLAKGIDPEVELGTGAWSDILACGTPGAGAAPAHSPAPRTPAHNPDSNPAPGTEPANSAAPDEFEDAYQRHFPRGLPFPDTAPNAFHMKYPLLERGSYRVIDGTLSTSAVLAVAKRFGVSLTELMVAVYLSSLQRLWHETLPRPRESFIAVEVPINLRALFPSRTYRNFSLFVLIGEDMRLGTRSIEELAARTHYQMKLEYDRMSIAKHLSRNAGSARSLAVRIVPLGLKDIFARILFAKFGETMLSGFISNLGAVKMPPGFAPHIRSFGFIPAPSQTTMTNASMLSWGDELRISFGSLAQPRGLERYFFGTLRELGLRARVRCRLDQASAVCPSEEEHHAVLS